MRQLLPAGPSLGISAIEFSLNQLTSISVLMFLMSLKFLISWFCFGSPGAVFFCHNYHVEIISNVSHQHKIRYLTLVAVWDFLGFLVLTMRY